MVNLDKLDRYSGKIPKCSVETTLKVMQGIANIPHIRDNWPNKVQSIVDMMQASILKFDFVDGNKYEIDFDDIPEYEDGEIPDDDIECALKTIGTLDILTREKGEKKWANEIQYMHVMIVHEIEIANRGEFTD